MQHIAEIKNAFFISVHRSVEREVVSPQIIHKRVRSAMFGADGSLLQTLILLKFIIVLVFFHVTF